MSSADDLTEGTVEGRAQDVDPPLAQLLRWEASGAHWQVLHRPQTPGGELELALLSCDAGEEMTRLRSADPALTGHVGDRDTDQD